MVGDLDDDERLLSAAPDVDPTGAVGQRVVEQRRQHLRETTRARDREQTGRRVDRDLPADAAERRQPLFGLLCHHVVHEERHSGLRARVASATEQLVDHGGQPFGLHERGHRFFTDLALVRRGDDLLEPDRECGQRGAELV